MPKCKRFIRRAVSLLVLFALVSVFAGTASFATDDDTADEQSAIQNFSEIAPLKKVLMHRPGEEFLNLTPNSLERLLFDDIPYLKTAQEEHDALAELLRANGIEVVYLTDLVAEALDAGGDSARAEFLNQFIVEAGINSPNMAEKCYGNTAQ